MKRTLSDSSPFCIPLESDVESLFLPPSYHPSQEVERVPRNRGGKREHLTTSTASVGRPNCSKFLKQREATGIVGVSLEVTDLETARNLLGKRASLRLSPYAGNKQHSLLVPPEFASGIWVEMFEKS